MANDPTSMIRNIINRLDETMVDEQTIMEKPLDGLKAGFGDKTAQGRVMRADLTKRLVDGWKVWQGQTGAKGSVDDVVKYLHVRAGFTPDDIREIMRDYDIGGPLADMAHDDMSSDDDAETATPRGNKADDNGDDDSYDDAPNKEMSKTAIGRKYNLSPDQEEELEQNGSLTLDSGVRIWRAERDAPVPPTLRMIKNDPDGAADEFMKMEPEEAQKVMSAPAVTKIKKKDIEKVVDKVEDKVEEKIPTVAPPEEDRLETLIADLRATLDTMTESIQIEEDRYIVVEATTFNLDKLKTLFSTAAAYAFENGVLDRPENSAQNNGSSRSSGGRGQSGSSEDAMDGNGAISAGALNKINAFLRQNDIDNDVMFSLRETSKRARGLGSFKGSNDMKYLAMIGMAFLKYRDS